MKKLILIITMLVLTYSLHSQITWVAPSSADNITNPLWPTDESIKEGKKLYKQLCSICHGDKGKGDGLAGASLNPRPANLSINKGQSDGALYWKLNEGRPPMASYKFLLTEDQKWQLINYIRTLKKKK